MGLVGQLVAMPLLALGLCYLLNLPTPIAIGLMILAACPGGTMSNVVSQLAKANLALFEHNPEKYAPQYGGYCAWAVAQGHTASGDPQVWEIINDKLYLNYDVEVQGKWLKDTAGFIIEADKKWPALLK